MTKYIVVLILFSFLLIFANSRPSKRKHRDSDTMSFEEKIEETVSEEKNETLIAVLTKFNDFYTDILPELKLTIDTNCDEDKLNMTATKYELTPVTTTPMANVLDLKSPFQNDPITFQASSLDCLTLDANACAASLRKQFNKKVKETYVREISNFIRKVSDIYTAILKDLPKNDPHRKGIEEFLSLISTDLPKLNTSIELEMLDNMFKAMHDDLKPKFSNAKIDTKSKKLYEDLIEKHSKEKPSKEVINENKNSYINKVWKELIEDLRAVELIKRL